MNNTIVTGRIGKDAEVKTFDGGRAVINFSLAWSEKYKDRQGEQQERIVWYDCAVWRKQEATGVSKFLRKGAHVLVQGEVSGRGWVNDAAEVKVSLTITVRDLEILQYVKDEDYQPQPQAQPQPQNFAQQAVNNASAAGFQANQPAANPSEQTDFFKSDQDDLPF